MLEISLGQGAVAQVDDEDADWLSLHTWSLLPSGRTAYARTHIRGEDGVFRWAYMHVMILRHHGSLPDGLMVDHIDGDGLNNRKGNLRPATHAQNHQNRRKFEGCSSQYKGVSFYSRRQTYPWRATIHIDKKQRHLGYYKTEKEAALAYDRAAREAFGDYARLNFSTLASEARVSLRADTLPGRAQAA